MRPKGMLRDLSRVIQLLSVGDGIFIPLLNHHMVSLNLSLNGTSEVFLAEA